MKNKYFHWLERWFLSVPSSFATVAGENWDPQTQPAWIKTLKIQTNCRNPALSARWHILEMGVLLWALWSLSNKNSCSKRLERHHIMTAWVTYWMLIFLIICYLGGRLSEKIVYVLHLYPDIKPNNIYENPVLQFFYL